MFEPLGSNHTMEEMQRIGNAYMAMPSTNGFKKPILHPVGAPGSFFIGSIVGFTNYWFRLGGNCGGFWYTDSRGSNGGSRGLYHSDIVQGHANVRLTPHPPFETVHLQHMNHAVKLRPPPRPLILSEATAQEKRPSEILERVQSQFTNGGGGVGGSDGVSLTMYAREHQLTPEIAQRMVKEAKAAGVVGMEYHWEPISDDVGGYEIKFHLK